jgi:hypothetical protein
MVSPMSAAMYALPALLANGDSAQTLKHAGLQSTHWQNVCQTR